VRAGLAKLIGSNPYCKVVGEASNGWYGLRLARELLPDVVLLDISMPGLNGLDACALIISKVPQTKVIILSMHSAPDLALRAASTGASGYVLKDSAPEELELALQCVMNGERFFSPRLGRGVETLLRQGAPGPGRELLSPREREVLQLIADCSSTREIARRLELSPKTVETHRMHIMRKLDIFNVAGLTRYAIRNGFIHMEA
jgi:DNA-binding NarL/FixJ family response regulator